MAVASGIATWCRITTQSGQWLRDYDVGAAGSGAAVTLTPTNVYAGGLVRIDGLTLNE